jgi:transposase InsO family protein
MKFAFIDAEKAEFAVGFMCRELEVSRSGFYAWRGRAPSARALDEAVLTAEVRAAHVASRGTYGSPRVHAVLKAGGRGTSRKRVARIMRTGGLVARCRRRSRRTTDSKHVYPIAPNLLDRNFTTTAPNRVWVTDITYVWTREGWLYVAAILDLFSRMVVGWALSERIDRKLCLDALAMAVAARKPASGLVHHSDRGSQYASIEYRRALADQAMICSMSRKGDCWDNAVAESFWGTLKAELVDGADYPTRDAARTSIFEFTEAFYNRQRLHSTLNYVSPAQAESRYYETPVD